MTDKDEWRSEWKPYPLTSGIGLYVRWRDDDGRLVPADVFVTGDAVTSAVLRQIPLGRIEAAMNTADAVAAERERPVMPEPSLQQLRLHAQSSSALDQAQASESRKRRSKLTRPAGEDPDAFYRRVATAYAEYARTTRAASASIAEEAGVPVTTAHRWVREARRRGFLPAGRQGKTG